MMIGWFRPTCPVDPAAKEWIEERLAWLKEEFPSTVFNGRETILPLAEFFPDRFDGSKRSVRAMLDRVCEYMDVVPDLVELKFVAKAGKLWLVNDSGQYLAHTAGTYQEGERKSIIRIDRAGLDDVMGLVGTIAHELAHVRLLGEGRCMSEEFDNELLTDLTVVAMGLGVFLANTPRTWASEFTLWTGTQVRKPEYMTLPMFGYALAHVAWFQGERKPPWARHLNSDARCVFKQGVRYLDRTGDSTFRPRRGFR